MDRFHIETKIVIQSSIDKVWNVLVDFTNYEKWNAFIPSASGKLSVGSILDITMHPPGEKTQKYKVKILHVADKKNLQWLGHFIIPGLIDGHHTFELHQMDNNETLLIHKETFRGLVVPFVWKRFLNTKLRAGLELLNEGLKLYVESTKDFGSPKSRSTSEKDI